jgi:hypothetical protein
MARTGAGLGGDHGRIVGRQHAGTGIELELHDVIGAEHRHIAMLVAGVDEDAWCR